MDIKVVMKSGKQYEFDTKLELTIEQMAYKISKSKFKFIYFGSMILNVAEIESIEKVSE